MFHLTEPLILSRVEGQKGINSSLRVMYAILPLHVPMIVVEDDDGALSSQAPGKFAVEHGIISFMGPVDMNPVKSRVLGSDFFFEECHERRYAILGKNSRLLARQGEVVIDSIEALSAYLGLEKVEMVNACDLAIVFTQSVEKEYGGATFAGANLEGARLFRLYQGEERGPGVNVGREPVLRRGELV
jgi:hypothetical protein